MDQNLRSKGAWLTLIILSGCAIMTLVLGIPWAASYPDKNWWMGLLLVLCGVLLIIGVINTYRSAKKEKKISSQQMAAINDLKKGKPADKIKIEILANWIYTVSEWKEFMKWEKRKCRFNTFSEAIILIVLSTMAIHYLKDTDWGTAAAISIVFGFFYSLIRYLLNLSSIQLGENKMPEVIITNESIIVNGHMNRFYGNNLWLGKVTINETSAFNVLEITYCWYTRSGQASEEIRAPIPKGSLKEAIFLQERLMNEKKLREQPH